MSKLGVNIGQGPTGLGDFLQQTHAAGSPSPVVFALDINVHSDIATKSPTTKLVYRTQQFGADNGNMYQGDALAAGRARVDQCIANWRLNPADWYSADNEPGRSDAVGLTWLCNYNLGQMQRADELGVKLGVGAWSTGMPPISADESTVLIESVCKIRTDLSRNTKQGDSRYELAVLDSIVNSHEMVESSNYFSVSIDYPAIYTPMLRYAKAHGHILLLHEYSLNGPMIGSPLCLRYRDLYAVLPTDARAPLVISEAGPDAGYGAGYTGASYINVVAPYDAETWQDDYLIGVCLYTLKNGESNMAEVMPLLTDYVIDHPTPINPPDPDPDPDPIRTYERVAWLVPPSVIYGDAKYNTIALAAKQSRGTVTASADDAFAVVPNCTKRTVVVYNVAEYGGIVALEDWVRTYYAPVPAITYRTV